MKKVILGTAMVVAIVAGVSATSNENTAIGKKAGAACCNMDECCMEETSTNEDCCMAGCCKK